MPRQLVDCDSAKLCIVSNQELVVNKSGTDSANWASVILINTTDFKNYHKTNDFTDTGFREYLRAAGAIGSV